MLAKKISPCGRTEALCLQVKVDGKHQPQGLSLSDGSQPNLPPKKEVILVGNHLVKDNEWFLLMHVQSILSLSNRLNEKFVNFLTTLSIGATITRN